MGEEPRLGQEPRLVLVLLLETTLDSVIVIVLVVVGGEPELFWALGGVASRRSSSGARGFEGNWRCAVSDSTAS